MVERFLWVFVFLMLILLHHKPLILFSLLNGILFLSLYVSDTFDRRRVRGVSVKTRVIAFNYAIFFNHKGVDVSVSCLVFFLRLRCYNFLNIHETT